MERFVTTAVRTQIREDRFGKAERVLKTRNSNGLREEAAQISHKASKINSMNILDK
jgi:hypothetical protein